MNKLICEDPFWGQLFEEMSRNNLETGATRHESKAEAELGIHGNREKSMLEFADKVKKDKDMITTHNPPCINRFYSFVKTDEKGIKTLHVKVVFIDKSMTEVVRTGSEAFSCAGKGDMLENAKEVGLMYAIVLRMLGITSVKTEVTTDPEKGIKTLHVKPTFIKSEANDEPNFEVKGIGSLAFDEEGKGEMFLDAPLTGMMYAIVRRLCGINNFGKALNKMMSLEVVSAPKTKNKDASCVQSQTEKKDGDELEGDAE